MTICSECGAEVRDISKFCPECGEKLLQSQETSDPTPSSQPHSPIEESPIVENKVAKEEIPAQDHTAHLPQNQAKTTIITAREAKTVSESNKKGIFNLAGGIITLFYVVGGFLFLLVILSVMNNYTGGAMSSVKKAGFPDTNITHIGDFFDNILEKPSWSQNPSGNNTFAVTVSGYSYFYQEKMKFTFEYNSLQKATTFVSVERADGTVLYDWMAVSVLGFLGAF